MYTFFCLGWIMWLWLFLLSHVDIKVAAIHHEKSNTKTDNNIAEFVGDILRNQQVTTNIAIFISPKDSELQAHILDQKYISASYISVIPEDSVTTFRHISVKDNFPVFYVIIQQSDDSVEK